MEKYVFSFENEDKNRADSYIANALGQSRNSVLKLFEQNLVLINGNSAKKNQVLSFGDTVEVSVPDPVLPKLVPQDIPLDIIYEDECLLVVNKPKGMVVHPAPGHFDNTLCNALLYHCKDSLSGINGVLRPGIVHRIDKDTSGLLMVAKNDSAHNFLAQQIKEHSFNREYAAVCHGVFKDDNGIIEASIGRHPIKRKQMAVTDKNSKPAKTEYFVKQRFNNFTYLKFKLYTGRTHQIRVHTAYIGHPVAGDPLYSGHKTDSLLNGQCLHAQKLGFIHPVTEKYMEFESD
ncbi:MAG: RluA family pseudouridine synthase, partial [Oscillospiraceae bacterium]|nr:RluA family pseudouridine synthase [Candidatus Equicaccousia limihippi]